MQRHLRAAQIRLRSLFAEAQEDEMLFEVLDVDQEQLQLLDTPFVASLEPRLFDYLTKTHSIPAFLSSVTLALFERQTFMGT
jgi:mitotic spindle assembly checkpoint protein MAD1